MFWKQLARVIAVLALFCVPLVAQQSPAQQAQTPPAQQAQEPQAQEGPAHVTLQGTVRTADGTPIPGASVTIKDVTTAKQWVTWTDEAGKFRLPELPGGKFHIEAAQIGFVSAVQDVAPTQETSPDIILSLRVATLDEIAKASAPAAPPTGTTPTNPPTGTEAGKTTPPPGTPPTTQTATNTPPPSGKNAKGNQNAGNQGGGRGNRNGNGGGFTGVNVGGQGGADASAGADLGGDQSGLGGAASSDAMLMNGTVATSDTSGINMNMGGAGGGQSGLNGLPVQGLNTGGGQGDMGGGFPGGGGGFPGGGGPPGGGGGPGGGGRGGGPGGGGGRGGGPGGPGGGRGGRAGQGQNGVPWGMQQLIRRRINTMHYTLNETLNDSAFNARPWSATGNDVPKTPFETNNFGGSLGGPFRIPKIYDGRDRTFFFINANFLTGTQGVTDYSLVPTADQRAGNFCTSGITLYDYTSNFAGPRNVLPGTGTGNCNLAGAINPVTSEPYISPIAAALMQTYIPSPNLSAVATSPTGQFYNYVLQDTLPTNRQMINFRVNQTITKKINFGAVYNISQAQTNSVGNFAPETSTSSTRGQNVTLTMNYNINPRMTDTVTANFSRNRSQGLNSFANTDNIEGTLGIGGVSTLPINYGLPGVSFTGGLTGLGTTNPTLRRNQTWILTNSLLYAPPKHTFHFGYQFLRYQVNSIAPPTPDGRFTFTGSMTENFTTAGIPVQQASTASAAYSIADFLLGLPQSTSVQFGSAPDCGLTCASNDYLRAWGMIGYATDDWHWRPSLTITYGLRYELMLPPTELFGHLSNLDLDPTFMNSAVVTPGVVGPFSGPLPNSLIRPDYKNLAPAFAIAWRVPANKLFPNKRALTVRAGYRIADNSRVYNSSLSTELLNQPPFGTAEAPKTSATNVLTFANGFPAVPTNTNTNTEAVNPNYKNLYVQTWSLSLESQIVDGLVWQLTYTGIKGTGLDLLSAPNVLSSTNTNTGTISNALGFTYDSSGASSIYHGLQARLNRRMKNGLTFTALYTFSKSIDNSSSIGGGGGTVVQEFPFFSLERGLSTFNHTHVITGNSTYELPFGERKHWAKKGAEARIFGNFRLSGSVTFQTGAPFTALVQGAVADFSGSQNFSTRADVLAGCNPNAGPRTLGQWFNTACFAAPGTDFPGTSILAPGTLFGDAGRDTIIGPSSFIVNLALQRTMQLNRDGQHTLNLRWEVSNLANTPNYSAFGTVVNTGSSFGKITSAAGMRTMDAVIRLNF
ncbi:MAG TPA: TonB-dependent receptor [Candidatus Acidoferrum sp.]|nr:TonB-dependent receptor [Candidatus Acidoferrum sp.]